MPITALTDLPDLVILNIFVYLRPFHAIQAFYDLDDRSDRFIHLLIECRYFSTIHHLRYALFDFVCREVLPRMGEKLRHLTLDHHQLQLAEERDILGCLSNLSSLCLLNVLEINEQNNALAYVLRPQLENLSIDFIGEHHLEAPAFVCEQFLFDQREIQLSRCRLSSVFGIQLQHLNLFPNRSIEELNIQLKDLCDLHLLFDNLKSIRVLHVQLCQWTINELKYDYRKLTEQLPYLKEFSLRSEHALNFERVLRILQPLYQLEKLSLVYRNYDEYGIDIERFQSVLSRYDRLKEFHLVLKFVYFQLNPKLTFEQCLAFKEQWNIQSYVNLGYKTYLAYTKPWIADHSSLSTDFLFDNPARRFPTVTHLHLTTHAKQSSLVSLFDQLTRNFPSLTHFHLVDSFGIITETTDESVQLPKISSFVASDVKLVNVFAPLVRSMSNLTDLHVNLDLLHQCDLRVLFRGNAIKSLELVTNNFEQIVGLLPYFLLMEQLTVNTKKQSTPGKRRFYRLVLDWFEVCSQLFIIQIKAHRLADLFYGTRLLAGPSLFVQYEIEMLTVWR